ncbi:putative uncharacterized protein [Waddlia chondrophila 2032/99]|nr:putative uncharacterized protein [Waddlia chondrophila 2032/99]
MRRNKILKIEKFLFTFTILALNFTLMTGCYRIPKEGEYSVIPATNNPSVVGTHKPENPLTSSGF